MIEDPDLTHRILEYFASDDVKFPANKTVGELVSCLIAPHFLALSTQAAKPF